jgi:sporulation protein YabP
MAEYALPHNIVLENREKMSVTGVSDVDTFDENKIVLFIPDDTIIIEGEDLHIQKLDISSGELTIEGEIYSFCYTGSAQGGKASKGFFKKMLR